MKKKRLIKLICSLCLMCFATLTLSACGASNPVSKTEEGAGYVPGGGPESAPSATPPGGGSSDSNVEIGEDGSLGEGMTVDFSQYFKGYTVLTNGNNAYTVKDENGNDVLFNDLLDRQFDVLAQDLIYRLSYVYGNVRIDTTTDIGRAFELKINSNGSDVDYTLNSKPATMDSTKVVSSTTCSHASDKLDLTCLSCYQKFLNAPQTNDNRLFDRNNLYLAGAIDGKFTSLNAFQLLDSVVEANKWNYVLTDVASITTNKNKIKMALAQIVANKTADGNYSSTNYDNLLSSINTLGLFGSYKDKIVEFILDVVIDGSKTLVENDNLLIEESFIKDTKQYLVDDTFMVQAPYPGNPSFTDAQNTKSPRLYKGYNVLVPAMVDLALNNTFMDTETSIYPHFSRVNGAIGTFETVETPSKDQNGEDTIVQNLTTTGSLNLNSIILMPQKGAQPISLGLQIDVARAKSNDYPAGLSVGDPGYVEYFVRDIVVELEVDITYKVGSTLVNISKAVADESKGSSIITLDSRTGYIMKQLDYNDPNFDPNKAANDEAYKEQFMKPVPNPDGQILPYDFTYSLYEHFENETVPPLDEYTGYNPLIDTNTLWDNKFVKDSVNNMIYLDAGPSYIQINFNIVSIKKYGGDNNSQLTDYVGNDVVFDITVKPYT